MVVLLMGLTCLSGCGISDYDYQFSEPEKGDTIAIIKTTMGDIKVRFFEKEAPKAVENFITHAKNGYYDGVSFFRVIEDFMIQGGCPQGSGTGGPGYCIKGEFQQNGFANDLKHERGVISMARTMAPDSAGSQFFIMHRDVPDLDGGYAAFGKVTRGMEVVDQIAQVRVDFNDRPLKPQKMKSVVVDTFEEEYEEPDKI